MYVFSAYENKVKRAIINQQVNYMQVKKLFTLLAAAMVLFGVQDASAQTDEEYDDALASIISGAKYCITTDVSGTKYYLTVGGELTTAKVCAGIFTITKVTATSGYYKQYAFKIHGTSNFSNHSTNNTDYPDNKLNTDTKERTWDTQVLFLNTNGKYAVRSTNTDDLSDAWNAIAGAFWTVKSGLYAGYADYSSSDSYIWNFEAVYTTTSACDANQNHPCSYLFDGNKDTKWELTDELDTTVGRYCKFSDGNGNVVFETFSAVYVKGITLTTGNDTGSYWYRNPIEFTLFGSNDDAAATNDTHDSWTEIGHVTNASIPAENKVSKHFEFTPSLKAFKYFKFHVNKVGEMDNSDIVQLSELELDYTINVPIIHINNGGGYGGEGAANLFDGLSSTKWCKGNNASTNWVVFKTAKPIYASSYTIQTANDSKERDPKTFKLYGALDAAPTTDGSTTGWTEIASETDASGTIPEDRYAFADFDINSPGIYQYFMFKATANRSSDGSFQMAELIIDNDDEKLFYITSDADMTEFASKVNSGSTSLNAFLMADVNSNSPVGTTTNKYAGTFDGQGHSVNLALNNSSDRCQGLFGYATGPASIRDLIVKGSVMGSGSTAALIGEVRDGTITISSVGCEATVNGGSGDRIGAFVGNDWGHTTVLQINNSYNIGEVTGGSYVSVVGSHIKEGSTFKNVYNKGTISSHNFYNDPKSNVSCANCYTTENGNSGVSGLTTQVTPAQVTNGELCYKLNGDQSDIIFYQTIGTGTYPTLDSSKPNVYKLTVGGAGYASFVPEVNVATIPTGITVYAGENRGSYLHLEEVTEVPADNAFIVKAAKGDYYYNNTDATRSYSAENDLTYSATALTSDGTQYCLAKKDAGVGFYQVQNGISIPARKVYLSVLAPVKAFYGFFDEDATSINEELRMKKQRSTAEGKVNEESEASILNLAGQRINKMQKGINIVNGKKVMF